MRGNPRRHGGRRMDDSARHTVDVVQRVVAMQVRIDRDEPIRVPRHESRERPGCHGLAGAKLAVLTQVGEIRRHEAHAPGAQRAGGVRQEYEREDLVVRTVQRADQDDTLVGALRVDPQIGLAVRKLSRLHGAERHRGEFADSPGERCALWEGQHHRAHGVAPMTTTSACAVRYSRAYASSPGLSACSVNNGWPPSTL